MFLIANFSSSNVEDGQVSLRGHFLGPIGYD